MIFDLVVEVAQLETLWKQQHPNSTLFEEARKITPGGVSHTMMIERWPVEHGVYPFYVTKADGTKIYDGTEMYIPTTTLMPPLSWGTHIQMS